MRALLMLLVAFASAFFFSTTVYACGSVGESCSIGDDSGTCAAWGGNSDTLYCDISGGSGTGATSNPGSTGATSNPGGGVLINPLQGGGSLWSLLDGILTFVINIGAIVVVLMMVYVGFKFVTAQGNETKVTEAKKMLLWTVIGALILLGAKAISLGIQATVNALSVGR